MGANNADIDDRLFWKPSSKRSLSNMVVRAKTFEELREPEFWHQVPSWYRNAIIARASEALGTPWPTPSASGLLDYYRKGDRESYESLVRQRQARLTTATLAFLETTQEMWLDEILDGILLLCEQLSWCWPEHDDCFRLSGSIFPERGRPYLDLGASEVAAQLAWVINVLGDQLEIEAPGVTGLVMAEVTGRCFIPRVHRTDWKWLGTESPPNNWLAWIDGNLLGAALAIYDGSELMVEVIWECLRGLDRFLDSLPADGAADEGFSYWWVGAGKALPALDLFAQCTSQTAEIDFGTPRLRETIAFPARMHLGRQWFFSYADTVARPKEPLPWHILERLATTIKDYNSMDVAREMSSTQVGEYCPEWGLLQNLQMTSLLVHRLPAFDNTDLETLGNKTVLASRDIAIFHQSRDTPGGITVTLKGGTNAESHNHLDLGSITISLDGVPVVIDPGRETYTKQSFGPDRYEMWYVQSQWHGTPRINGIDQCFGEQYVSEGFSVTDDIENATASLCLDHAYPVKQFHWERRVTLKRADECVEVCEEYANVSEAEVVLIIAGKCDIDGDQVIVTPIAGERKLNLRFPEAKVRQETRALEDPLMRGSWGESIARLTVGLPVPLVEEKYRWFASIAETEAV